tara:strand:+ start:357 stop:617 length:261 start_codon:yes stop_codon:yes gene_type:complete
MENSIVTVKYKSSVLTMAGWRSTTIVANANYLSAKRVEIISVELIDGLTPSNKMSLTGSKRQTYDGLYYSNNEAGKVKNISSLELV